MAVAESLSMKAVDWKKLPTHTHTRWIAEGTGTEMPQAHGGFLFYVAHLFHGLLGHSAAPS